MSYTQVKNLKIVKLNNGKFNASGEIADSSIRDKDGKMIFNKTDRIFKEDYNSKNELKYVLFKLFLDGELHGATGEFKILDWENAEGLRLPTREEILIEKLEQKAWKCKNTINFDRYEKIRYALYYRAWQKYNHEQKTNKYIITLNKNGVNYYITKLNKKTYSISNNKNEVKVFAGLPSERILSLAKLNDWIIENC